MRKVLLLINHIENDFEKDEKIDENVNEATNNVINEDSLPHSYYQAFYVDELDDNMCNGNENEDQMKLPRQYTFAYLV